MRPPCLPVVPCVGAFAATLPHMNTSVNTLLSAAVVIALITALGTGCTRKLMPGVWVTHDARVVEANAEVVRTDMEFRLAQAISREFAAAQTVRVQIPDEPRRSTRRGREREDGRGRWRWAEITVQVEMSDVGESHATAQVRSVVQEKLKPHVRDPSAVQVSVQLLAPPTAP